MKIMNFSYGVKCFGQLSPDLVEVLALVTRLNHDGCAREVHNKAMVIIWKKAAP